MDQFIKSGQGVSRLNFHFGAKMGIIQGI